MGFIWAKYKDIKLHICNYNDGKISTPKKKISIYNRKGLNRKKTFLL